MWSFYEDTRTYFKEKFGCADNSIQNLAQFPGPDTVTPTLSENSGTEPEAGAEPERRSRNA